jgi:PAS domain S-box-containing protein
MMKQLRVLIAEDDPVGARQVSLLVEREGHIVLGVVSRGSEVPAAAAAHKPDVVLMDVHLADDVTGISATRDLLRRTSVPVVVISGTDSREEMEAIAASGALGYIKKPVSIEELRVNLRLALHQNEVLQKLRSSELLHRSIFDNAAVGIYVGHPDGFYLSVNHAFSEMLGYAGPAELLRLVHSMDEQVYEEKGRRETLLERLRRGESVRDFESSVLGRDGDLIWVAEHVTPGFNENGELDHYEGVVINITDRKRAEDSRNLAHNLLQNTVDAVSGGIVATDLDGNIILSNRTFTESLARHCPDGALRFSGPAADIFERFQREFERQGAKAELREAAVLFGTDTPVSVVMSPYLNRQGGLLGAVFLLDQERMPGCVAG